MSIAYFKEKPILLGGPSEIILSGRTNLSYLPKCFRKGKGERKDRTKEV